MLLISNRCDLVNIYSCSGAYKISYSRSLHVLKLESDYDFIPMFVQQTLLIDQMRNLIMTAEEWEEAESEAIDYTRINVGIMCGTMLDRR